MKTKKLYQKVLSMVLAVVMVVSVFAVSAPTEVSAATMSFNGKGTSAVTISDAESYELLPSGAPNLNKLKTYYIPFKASVNGYVTLTFQNASQLYTYTYGTLQLCDKNKKALSMAEAWNNNPTFESNYYTRTYGVKKGQSYNFKIECDGGTKITAKVSQVKTKLGKNKAKATNLKKGKKTEGYVVAGTKTAAWYKIKMTSSAKLRLTFSAKTNGVITSGNYIMSTPGGIKVSFMDTKGKLWTSGTVATLTTAKNMTGWDIYMTKSGAKFDIPKGTYYIKVEPTSKQYSGEYSLQWKTF